MATSSNGSDRDTSAVYDGFYLVGIVCGWQFVRGGEEEAVMKAWIGVSLVAAALAFASPAAFAETKAAPKAKTAAFGVTDFGARRVYRRYPAYPAYARYPSYPAYYARPYYYRPYPYGVPVPFFLGFGYLPYY
jgi:hypothetical protein